MPNHVTNQVSISGNAESLAKLKAVLFAPGIPDSSDDEKRRTGGRFQRSDSNAPIAAYRGRFADLCDAEME